MTAGYHVRTYTHEVTGAMCIRVEHVDEVGIQRLMVDIPVSTIEDRSRIAKELANLLNEVASDLDDPVKIL